MEKRENKEGEKGWQRYVETVEGKGRGLRVPATEHEVM